MHSSAVCVGRRLTTPFGGTHPNLLTIVAQTCFADLFMPKTNHVASRTSVLLWEQTEA